MKFARNSFAVVSVVMICNVLATAYAQDRSSKLLKTSVSATITKAEMSMLGRVQSGPTVFVTHAISYCLRGTGATLIGSRGLQVRFVSNKLTQSLLDADALVKGSLVRTEEPLDGTKDRCGTIEFDVNADAITGLELMSASSNSRLLLESGDGSVISSAPVQPKRVSAQ